jgi:hypothetical protein
MAIQEYGVSRRVFYEAWCRECHWHGEERTDRQLAAMDMAGHQVDKHGGSERGES